MGNARETALICGCVSNAPELMSHFNGCDTAAYRISCVRCVAAEIDAFYISERMAAPRHPLRDRILARVQRGEIASVAEVMLVAAIPRQTANRWLREAGIKLDEMRLHAVAKMRAQEMRFLEGRPMARRPTKAQMRNSLTKAVERFNRANAKPGGPMDKPGGAPADRSPRACAGPQME